MGLRAFYEERLLPYVCNLAMGGKGFREQRPHALRGLEGRVLELGFGSGHNLPFYPREVTEILAVEPSVVLQRLALGRVRASPIPVRFVGLRGEEIPLDAASVDAVLSTFTLCTIPDVGRALGEVERVLVPAGKLHFLEHGLSPDARVARWQRRLTPIQRVCAGGCHLDREIDRIVTAAGLELESLEQRAMKGPKIAAWIYDGRARK
jgi:SAM-dependent methyltransferase